MTKNYHHGDLRDALIRMTLDMVKQDEVHLIGFRELARRLEVSRTAPYRHFESVEALLAYVAEEGYRKFIADLEIVTQNPKWSHNERLQELGVAYVNFALNNPAHYRLMFDPRFFENKADTDVQKLASTSFGLLEQTASACLPHDASDEEKKNLANLSWACVHGISKLFIDGQWSQVQDRQKLIRNFCLKLVAMV